MPYAATESRTQTGKRSRRTLVVIAILCLIPVALTLFAYIASRYSGNMRLEQAFAEADRLDPGWRFQDLEDARRPYPAPEKNGIDQVLRVKAAMPKSMWPSWTFPQFASDKATQEDARRVMDESLEGERLAPTLLNSEQERVIRAEVARAQEAIDLARQMPSYPYGRYSVKWSKDYISTLLPHVQEARNIANLMTYDARLRAQDGDLAGSLHDVKAVLYASRAVGDEEIFISQLVRIACDSVAVRILERSLACGRAREAALLDLQTELETEAQTPFFLTGIRGERTLMDGLLEYIQNGGIPFTQFRRTMAMAGGFGPGFPNSDSWKTELRTLQFFFNIRSERAQMLHHMNMLVEAAKLPSWERIDAIGAQEASLKKNPPVWAILYPAAGKICQADARVRAHLRTAYTALAMERYHLAKGNWPKKLADLVPQYLKEVPKDPFDGAPLRLARKGSSVIVYSISHDRKDQGGALLQNPQADGADLGFLLLDPASRRRPAKPFVYPERPTPPPEEAPERGPEEGRP
jgi:hypothetical protein